MIILNLFKDILIRFKQMFRHSKFLIELKTSTNYLCYQIDFVTNCCQIWTETAGFHTFQHFRFASICCNNHLLFECNRGFLACKPTLKRLHVCTWVSGYQMTSRRIQPHYRGESPAHSNISARMIWLIKSRMINKLTDLLPKYRVENFKNTMN